MSNWIYPFIHYKNGGGEWGRLPLNNLSDFDKQKEDVTSKKTESAV